MSGVLTFLNIPHLLMASTLLERRETLLRTKPSPRTSAILQIKSWLMLSETTYLLGLGLRRAFRSDWFSLYQPLASSSFGTHNGPADLQVIGNGPSQLWPRKEEAVHWNKADRVAVRRNLTHKFMVVTERVR